MWVVGGCFHISHPDWDYFVLRRADLDRLRGVNHTLEVELAALHKQAGNNQASEQSQVSRLGLELEQKVARITQLSLELSEAKATILQMEQALDEATTTKKQLRKDYTKLESTLRKDQQTAQQTIDKLGAEKQALEGELAAAAERSELQLQLHLKQVAQLKAAIENASKPPELEAMLREEISLHKQHAEVKERKIGELEGIIQEQMAWKTALESSGNSTDSRNGKPDTNTVGIKTLVDTSDTAGYLTLHPSLPDDFEAFDAAVREQLANNSLDREWLKEYILLQRDKAGKHRSTAM